jgi:hypothetical protein
MDAFSRLCWRKRRFAPFFRQKVNQITGEGLHSAHHLYAARPVQSAIAPEPLFASVAITKTCRSYVHLARDHLVANFYWLFTERKLISCMLAARCLDLGSLQRLDATSPPLFEFDQKGEHGQGSRRHKSQNIP